MEYKKSNMSGMVSDYQKMYDAIKNWNESSFDKESKDHYLYGMGWAIDDMPYHGWTGDAAENERHHYVPVCYICSHRRGCRKLQQRGYFFL